MAIIALIVPLSEVTAINKQKFLAELGKLLTFMYEEDRQRAIALYARIFEDAPDEQTALQVLNSPTRQAVIVARVYNAKERKLQVEAQTRELEEDEDEAPEYLLLIQDLYDQIVPEDMPLDSPEDQISLFDEEEPQLPAEEPESDVSLVPPTDEEEEAPAPEAPVPESVSAPVPAEESAAAPEEAEEPTEESAVSEDEVDAFLASFTIEGDELIDRQAEAEAAQEAQPLPEAEADEAEEDSLPAEEDAYEEDEEDDEDEAPVVLRRQARPLLLILYILIAVPVCAIGVLLLLIPTLLCLALAVGVIAVGAALLITAFSGFAVLADILLVLGAALVVLAVGLLLLWLFIWFIGGPIVGLIRGVVHLGGRWCYKEVAA